jgi:hypothetical protein
MAAVLGIRLGYWQPNPLEFFRNTGGLSQLAFSETAKVAI